MADSEKYFTKLVDGQLSVATVAQSGEIIPEESRPGEKYTTALVQTDDGPQLCVKTYDLNGGGGGGGTVDQTYDPTSTNAQSGTAVAEAVAPALKNTATGTNSLTILGTAATTTKSINIGQGSGNPFNNYIVEIGADSSTQGYGGVTLGQYAQNSGHGAIAIGHGARIEGGTSVSKGSIAIGGDGSNNSSPSASSTGIARIVNAEYAIQLGKGTNTTANSFQVFSYQMLDGTTGKIPMARLPIVQLTQADYDALVSGGTVDANTIYCIIPA